MICYLCTCISFCEVPLVLEGAIEIKFIIIIIIMLLLFMGPVATHIYMEAHF